MERNSISTSNKEEKHEKIRQLIEDHKKDVLEKIKNRNTMKSIISARALSVPYSPTVIEEKPEEKRITISISNNPPNPASPNSPPPSTNQSTGGYKKRKSSFFDLDDDNTPPATPTGGSSSTRSTTTRPKYKNELTTCHFCKKRDRRPKTRCSACGVKYWMGDCCRECFEQNIKGRKVCPCSECVAGLTKGRRYGPRKLKDLPKTDYSSVLPFPSVPDQFPLMLPSLFNYTRGPQATQGRSSDSAPSNTTNNSSAYSTKIPSIQYMHTSSIKHSLPAPAEIDKPILVQPKQQFRSHPSAPSHQQVASPPQDKLQNTVIHISQPPSPPLLPVQPPPTQSKKTKHEVTVINDRPLSRLLHEDNHNKRVEFPPIGASMRDVEMWLEDNGMSEYIPQFSNNKIDGEAMHELGEDDLRALGVLAIGDRKKILRRIKGAHYDQITDITAL